MISAPQSPFNDLLGVADRVLDLFSFASDDRTAVKVNVVRLLRLRDEFYVDHSIEGATVSTLGDEPLGKVGKNLFRLAEEEALQDDTVSFRLGAQTDCNLRELAHYGRSSFQCRKLSLKPDGTVQGTFEIWSRGQMRYAKTHFTGSQFSFPRTEEGIEAVKTFQRDLYDEIAATRSAWYRAQTWMRLKVVRHPIVMTGSLAILVVLVGTKTLFPSEISENI
ncbi:MAG: hypothetical protein HYW02_02470 [Deltaproteobacteria bacterium]|nr:hypothetical protein [Deltaproteobacteria bacterium]MBI2500337.1 hypothetical protein [Deltaproteobacteria bacterium]